jgi:hypothetical protein
MKDTAMHLCDIQAIPQLTDLSVFSNEDPRADELMNSKHPLDVAEAVDTFRLFEFLHRDQYKPLAIVQSRIENEGDVKVYFTRLKCGDG